MSDKPQNGQTTWPALEMVCEYCRGLTDPRYKCTNCDNRGTVPTPFGQAIINLVAKYLGDTN